MVKDSEKISNARASAENIIWSGVGVGFGMDYGGIGVNYTAYLAKNIGVFAGAGYAFAKIGYNVGMKFRYVPKNTAAKLNPFVLAMYGYNAAFTVTSEPSYSKLFTGFTAGIGTDFRANPQSKGYFSVALLFPFQNSDVKSYDEYLTTNFEGEFQNWVKSVGFSLGYHWIIGGYR